VSYLSLESLQRPDSSGRAECGEVVRVGPGTITSGARSSSLPVRGNRYLRECVRKGEGR